MRALLHGVPGAGKTDTLKWLRSFFETVMEWEHEKEFAFVAFQNSMAALLGGMTLHSFGKIPLNHTVKMQRGMQDREAKAISQKYIQ